MRYFPQPDVEFIDADGVSHMIKETRKFEKLETMMEIPLTVNSALDEIATRKDVYGDDAEGLIYKIFDHNIVSIVENGYDLSLMKTLKIPLV
jgi:hypothetical protein